MEILISIAYYFLVRLVFFDYRWLKWNMAWGIFVFGLYSAAFLTEIVLLGQYAPYSDKAFIQRPVVQISTYLGGRVSEIYVKQDTLIKKGDPLYKLDDAVALAQLHEAKANMAKAEQLLNDSKKLVAKKVMVAEALKVKEDDYLAAKADVDRYEYEVTQTTAYAPSDGYVINLQLRAGQFARLKQPVMTFVSSEEAWLVMKVRQEGSQYIKSGQQVEFALAMYPGEVFTSKVDTLIEGAGEAQMSPSGIIPQVNSIEEIDYFAVRVALDQSVIDKPLVFGASAIAAINTEQGADVFWLLRRIEVQSESLLSYLYNPFRS
jgi:multidrug resistance efflux pump